MIYFWLCLEINCDGIYSHLLLYICIILTVKTNINRFNKTNIDNIYYLLKNNVNGIIIKGCKYFKQHHFMERHNN